jgi:hypothetical protein
MDAEVSMQLIRGCPMTLTLIRRYRQSTQTAFGLVSETWGSPDKVYQTGGLVYEMSEGVR